MAKYQAIYSAGWDSLRDDRLASQIAQGLFAPGTTLSDKSASSGSIPDWNTLNQSQKDEVILRMSIYAAQVEILDQGVGKLIDAVRDPAGDGTGAGFDDDNLMDQTMFVFLSDNGGVSGGGFDGTGDISNWFNDASATNVKYGDAWANLSNTPFRKFKTDTYEGGITSPLIVSGYGVDPTLRGSVNTTDIGHVIDLAPTFFEVGGAEYPAGADASELEGVSLLGTFDGSNADLTQRDVFFEHEGNRGVRSGRWKLVAPNGSSNYELYDLLVDRAESNDLSDTHPDIESLLRLKWEAWAIRNQVATPDQDNAGSPFLSNSEIDWLSVGADPNVVALYNLSSGLVSTDAALDSDASVISLGSEILHSTVSSTLRAEGGDPDNTTLAAASANGFTAEFSITSDDGLDLSNLTFTARFNEMDAGETGILVLRSSADGFASNLASITNGEVLGTTDIPVDVDLTAFQGVNDLTFRFYFLGVNSATNERTRIVGPVTLRGVLAVALEGDYNGDGVVSQADLDLVLLNWGTDVAVSGPIEGWLHGLPDGVVSQAQLDAVLLNWGNANSGVVAVPEPAYCTVCLLAVLAGRCRYSGRGRG